MTDRGSTPDSPHPNGEALAMAAAEASARRLARAVKRLASDPEYVLGALADKLDSMHPVATDRLTDSEREFLVESGAFSKQELARAEARVDRGNVQLETIQGWLLNLLDTLSLNEVSVFLGEDADALRREVAEGSVYAVEVSGQLRFPRWQFSLGSPDKRLRGLDSIIDATTSRWDWQSVAGFMCTPQSDLTGEGRKTPVEWLRDGGEITAVTDIVESGDRA